ncbi:TIGR02611 family protein [Phytomonospora sp. NPDC050363]|uniref:TIGR02611 family protein n=1 Tax=Phytomonospora sp. NPDC050363 TaxID=3155642 RepID=UPI0033C98B48
MRDGTAAEESKAPPAEATEEPRTGIHGRLDRVRRTRSGRLTLKIVIGIAGFAVMALGFVLIPFPGPGWAIVLAGLAILALEFAWAHRLFTFTKHQLTRWLHWVGRQHWTVKFLIGLAGLIFVGCVVWLSVWMSFDINLVTEVTRHLGI